MIQADHITFEGATALYVGLPSGPLNLDVITAFDRPCGTCNGEESNETVGRDIWYCPDCIDGRHTFEIEVDRWALGNRHGPKAITLRVSVVPGVVLPIVADVGPVPDERHIRVTGAGIAWLAEPIDGGWKHTEIILPPAAKVDGWAIKFNVQPKEQQ